MENKYRWPENEKISKSLKKRFFFTGYTIHIRQKIFFISSQFEKMAS